MPQAAIAAGASHPVCQPTMNHPPGIRPPSSWAVVVGFALIYISWGTTYLPMRIAVHDEQIPPALFGGVRVFCGGILLHLFQICRGAGVRISRRDFGKIVGISWLLFVAGNGLMNAANQTVSSGVCAVLAATTPLWLGLFGMLWPRGERLTPRGWLGLLVGLAGVRLILEPQFSTPERFGQPIGIAFVLGSAASWAMGSLVLRHTRLTTAHLTTAAYQMICGGMSLTLVGVVLGEPQRLPEPISARAIGAFLYLLIVGSLVGFVAFNWLLRHVTAAKVGTYAYVNPVVAVLVGWVAGEGFTGWLAAGICVILLAVFLIRGGERPAQVAVLAGPDRDGVSDEDWNAAQVSEPT
jgi:drug/metabolite transporter (DMT)-like permease